MQWFKSARSVQQVKLGFMRFIYWIYGDWLSGSFDYINDIHSQPILSPTLHGIGILPMTTGRGRLILIASPPGVKSSWMNYPMYFHVWGEKSMYLEAHCVHNIAELNFVGMGCLLMVGKSFSPWAWTSFNPAKKWNGIWGFYWRSVDSAQLNTQIENNSKSNRSSTKRARINSNWHGSYRMEGRDS